MLSHLSISNYAISDHLEIDFNRGMTVLTGETGAGKSIMLDALGLCLGDRADGSVVRLGSERADIHALFDIADIPEALDWLKERELDSDDEVVLRRVITAEGRSRAYINGQPCTLADIKQLGGMLIDIHSQHAHQSLLKKHHQRQLLDGYADCTELSKEVAKLCSDFLHTDKTLTQLEQNSADQSAQEQLLRYQLEELERLELKEGEIPELEQEQQQLAHAEDILAANHHSLNLCKEGEVNALGILQQALSSLGKQSANSPAARSAMELLENARIQIDEAASELEHAIDSLEVDPEKLREVEERLDALYQIARKHKVQPEELLNLQDRLSEELGQLDASDERIDGLRQQRDSQLSQYRKQADKLSKQRQKAAKALKASVESKLAELAMKHCRIEFALSPLDDATPHPQGHEDVEIQIQTNPNAAWGPLSKIASGGELSRISLAIQVVAAQVSTIPTMVFDEVDVGIGGATAEIVGQMLNSLGQRGQVLCVTHQPQVASQGDHHLQVSKMGDENTLRTVLEALDEDRKIGEIARMLGGVAITENTLSHAREMLGIRH
ncbi:DNA repair protein RecN [Spongiibacter sp. KMU-158]|uniref:DNA repair protein RecN n=1 Tax=Spongiibacter pelagi TaxID=2760804 RepID=A0A927GWC2_9GAMM|nr:DNA repair protein RecN [Spongiibacter pelagi]MBD2859295.1 DNA repair protein RecN [Spongiibacter pelagi]